MYLIADHQSFLALSLSWSQPESHFGNSSRISPLLAFDFRRCGLGWSQILFWVLGLSSFVYDLPMRPDTHSGASKSPRVRICACHAAAWDNNRWNRCQAAKQWSQEARGRASHSHNSSNVSVVDTNSAEGSRQTLKPIKPPRHCAASQAFTVERDVNRWNKVSSTFVRRWLCTPFDILVSVYFVSY